MCLAEIPFKNTQKMQEHVANFKILLDAESKRLQEMMNNYDELIEIYKETLEAHANEEESEVEEKL